MKPYRSLYLFTVLIIFQVIVKSMDRARLGLRVRLGWGRVSRVPFDLSLVVFTYWYVDTIPIPVPVHSADNLLRA